MKAKMRISWIAFNVPKTLLVVALAITAATMPAQAAKHRVVYTFTGQADGGSPYASVITDAAGNLYGTTQLSGAAGFGVVYKLTLAGKETVLYSFAGGADGANPYAALLMDAAGNLYGTTSQGGGASGCFGSGCGTVFKLDTSGKETVLYAFQGKADGGLPYSALTVDKAGNIYGTASIGGDGSCGLAGAGCGVVYEFTTAGKMIVLYSFTGGADGAYPLYGSLAVDAKGNIYGATQKGGDLTCNPPAGCGVVYRLSKAGKQTVLHAFSGADGELPLSNPTLDAKGNLYGTAAAGGSNSKGVVFKIGNASATRESVPRFKVLHSFGKGTDGASPYGGVVIDSKGNLYIPTISGGSLGYGALCKVASTGKENVLHSFNVSVDGADPLSAVTIISKHRRAKAGHPAQDFIDIIISLYNGGTIEHGAGAGTIDYNQFIL